jgi:hypothetical protein
MGWKSGRCGGGDGGEEGRGGKKPGAPTLTPTLGAASWCVGLIRGELLPGTPIFDTKAKCQNSSPGIPVPWELSFGAAAWHVAQNFGSYEFADNHIFPTTPG